MQLLHWNTNGLHSSNKIGNIPTSTCTRQSNKSSKGGEYSESEKLLDTFLVAQPIVLTRQAVQCVISDK